MVLVQMAHQEQVQQAVPAVAVVQAAQEVRELVGKEMLAAAVPVQVIMAAGEVVVPVLLAAQDHLQEPLARAAPVLQAALRAAASPMVVVVVAGIIYPVQRGRAVLGAAA